MTSTPDSDARLSGVIPVLVYQDLGAAHDFLVQAFGFTSGGVERGPDDTVVHAEVRLGDSRIWLHLTSTDHQLNSPKDFPMSHGGLTVLVEDVDAHYAQAKASGARIDHPPVDQPYGLREYGVRDLESHRWWFSTVLPDQA